MWETQAGGARKQTAIYYVLNRSSMNGVCANGGERIACLP